VFHDADRDRWDVEHLPAGAADLLGVGQVRPAAAATGGFVPDDLVRVGDLIQGGAFVAGLPSGFAVGRATQGPRRRLAQSVAGRRFRGVPGVGPQLRLQLVHPDFQCLVLGFEFGDAQIVCGSHFFQLGLQRNDHCDEFRGGHLFHSSMIPSMNTGKPRDTLRVILKVIDD